MANNDRPKAKATPTLWTSPPAITAVPSPAKTSTKVPNNSAAYFILFSSASSFTSAFLQKSESPQKKDMVLGNSSYPSMKKAVVTRARSFYRLTPVWSAVFSALQRGQTLLSSKLKRRGKSQRLSTIFRSLGSFVVWWHSAQKGHGTIGIYSRQL